MFINQEINLCCKMDWLLFKEIKRKVIHLMILVVLIAYFMISKKFEKQIALLSLVALLLVFLIVEYLRLELNFRMSFFSWFIRPKEQNRLHGSIFFLISTIISLAIFDFRITLAALLMTIIGDSAVAIIGKRYGKTLIFGNKTVAGTLSGLCVNLAVCFIVLLNIVNIYVIITMAFVAAIVEMLSDELDDNLMVPLFSGF